MELIRTIVAYSLIVAMAIGMCAAFLFCAMLMIENFFSPDRPGDWDH